MIEGLRELGIDAGLYDPSGAPPDMLVLAKRYDTASVARARRLQARGTRVVFDLCDNHFHCEPPTPAWQRRAELLREAVRTADAVTVSTLALADVVRAECDDVRALHVVGDAVEPVFVPSGIARWLHPVAEWQWQGLERQLLKERKAGSLLLLWFGNHGSENAAGGMQDILRLRSALDSLAKRRRVSLTVISNHRPKYDALIGQLPVQGHYLGWERSTFSRAAAMHDIAVVPVDLNPFTSCKTNNRVATALMHGLAVVADPVPSYAEFAHCVRIGKWSENLESLAGDPRTRSAAVECGRSHIEQHWQLPNIARQWRDILTTVTETGC